MPWRLLYVLAWSGGLLFATFPSMIKGDFSFNLRTGNTPTDLIDHYTIPLMMAMALFLVDAIYAYAIDKSSDKNSRFICLMLAVVLFFVAYAMSLFDGKLLSVVMFITAWLSMTAMKYLTTPVIEIEVKDRGGNRIARN